METIELRILGQGASQDFECYARPGPKVLTWALDLVDTLSSSTFLASSNPDSRAGQSQQVNPEGRGLGKPLKGLPRQEG